ncbi:uncharacterized protein [Palaemon carinicauda]|uniref:uncharacterized protein n=1 Tax=Palaemon carinicauda TaxID=392227 RepID=UPI0035B5E503
MESFNNYCYCGVALYAKVISRMAQNLKDLIGASEEKHLCCYCLDFWTFISHVIGISEDESRSYDAQKEGIGKNLVREGQLNDRNKAVVESSVILRRDAKDKDLPRIEKIQNYESSEETGVVYGLVKKYEANLKRHKGLWTMKGSPVKVQKGKVKEIIGHFEETGNITGHPNMKLLCEEEYEVIREILRRDAKDTALARIQEILRYERSQETGIVRGLVKQYESNLKKDKELLTKKRSPIDVQKGKVKEIIGHFEKTGNITGHPNMKLLCEEEYEVIREILRRDAKDTALARIQDILRYERSQETGIVRGLVKEYESNLKKDKELLTKKRSPIDVQKGKVKKLIGHFEKTGNIAGHPNMKLLCEEEYEVIRKIIRRDAKDTALARIQEILRYERSQETGIVRGLVKEYESNLKKDKELLTKKRSPIDVQKGKVKEIIGHFEKTGNIIGHPNMKLLCEEEYEVIREILRRDAKDTALARIQEILRYERSQETGIVRGLVKEYESNLKKDKELLTKKRSPIDVQKGKVKEIIGHFEKTGNITGHPNMKLLCEEEYEVIREILRRDAKDTALARIQKILRYERSQETGIVRGLVKEYESNLKKDKELLTKKRSPIDVQKGKVKEIIGHFEKTGNIAGHPNMKLLCEEEYEVIRKIIRRDAKDTALARIQEILRYERSQETGIVRGLVKEYESNLKKDKELLTKKRSPIETQKGKVKDLIGHFEESGNITGHLNMKLLGEEEYEEEV